MNSPKLSLTEQAAFSTIRIEVITDEGICSGTGFFYVAVAEEGNNVQGIVTNKHVIKGAKSGTFLFTVADKNGRPLMKEHVPFKIENFEQQWILHPSKDVDLAFMPIQPIFNLLKEKGIIPFLINMLPSNIPSDETLQKLSSVEDILMVGYPIGLWDKENNYPIFRKGITATHPAIDYNGKPEFMIDAACFPGSSGSPVYIINESNYVDKNGSTVFSDRFLFLGILYAGPQFTSVGEIKVVDIPTKKDTVTVSRIPMNLGYVIKARKLLDFEKTIKDLLKAKK
ncbi:MAG: trypsin-like peptidase domain-containing protein [Melioribacteraceae bacterium]|nr:trypsin-like peptidase domain-containing protein [Melioribacteraceae bacterium]